MGRKKHNIDWNLVDNMLRADCEGTEIAARLGINNETLYKRVKAKYRMDFSEYLRLKRADGNATLKEKQYAQANAGDRTMLVWLGKQRLGQRERFDHSIRENRSINVVVASNVDAAIIQTALDTVDARNQDNAQ